MSIIHPKKWAYQKLVTYIIDMLYDKVSDLIHVIAGSLKGYLNDSQYWGAELISSRNGGTYILIKYKKKFFFKSTKIFKKTINVLKALRLIDTVTEKKFGWYCRLQYGSNFIGSIIFYKKEKVINVIVKREVVSDS